MIAPSLLSANQASVWKMSTPRCLFAVRFHLLAVASAALLSGCGSTPPSRFYVLTSIEREAEPAPGGPSVAIGAVEIPAYLDRPQMVTRAYPNEIRVEEYSRWAAPLKDIVPAVLAENLSALLPSERVTFVRASSGECEVAVSMARFERGADGLVALEARWIVSQGEESVARRSSIRREVGGEGSFADIATTQSKALEDLSREIAEAIRGMTEE